jgi:hypothetical protein
MCDFLPGCQVVTWRIRIPNFSRFSAPEKQTAQLRASTGPSAFHVPDSVFFLSTNKSQNFAGYFFDFSILDSRDP